MMIRLGFDQAREPTVSESYGYCAGRVRTRLNARPHIRSDFHDLAKRESAEEPDVRCSAD